MRHRGPRHLRALLPSSRHAYPQRRRTRWLPARHSMRLACGVAGFVLLGTAAVMVAGELGDDTVTASDAPRPNRVQVSQDASRSQPRASGPEAERREPARPAPEQTPDRTAIPEPSPHRTTAAPSTGEGDASPPATDESTADRLTESATPDGGATTVPSPDGPDATPTGGASATATTRRPPADTTSPQTTLDSAPEQHDDSEEALFSFHAGEPASFTCSLDGGAYAPCGSPVQYEDLAPGWHDFAVRATDDSGNVETSPVTYRWQTAPRND